MKGALPERLSRNINSSSGETPMTPLGEAAVKLGARGLRVFPCKHQGKEPAIKDNLRLAAVDPAIIGKMWGELGQWNIGLTTGARSGVWVLDVDADKGGRETLNGLEAEHGKLPVTVEVVTANGWHLYFRWPDGVEIRNAQHRDDLPGLDWRGEGGYVLAPPSVHPSGDVYAWALNGAADFARAPTWLLELVTARRQGGSGNGQSAPLPQEWAAFMERTHEGSHRASAIAKVFGLLVRKDVPSVVALEFARMFDREKNREPLGDADVERICNDIAELDLGRRQAHG
jgi:hypothetical protein